MSRLGLTFPVSIFSRTGPPDSRPIQQCFAFYIPYIFLAQYGASIGLSGSQAALATSMLSIGSTIGRFALSTVADYGGPLNVWAVAQFMATILFLMLPLCQSFGALAAYGVACGLVNGGFVSLCESLKCWRGWNGVIFCFLTDLAPGTIPSQIHFAFRS